MKVLFVCSGNICRSPIAAGCLRDRAPRWGLHGLVVDSAGTLGIEGAPASPEAIRAMREIGLDLSHHRSKGIEEVDVRSSDVIVAMARHHLEELASRFPEGRESRVLLRSFQRDKEADPAAPDLDDPMGLPVEIYRDQLAIIVRCVDHLALHLRERGDREAGTP